MHASCLAWAQEIHSGAKTHAGRVRAIRAWLRQHPQTFPPRAGYLASARQWEWDTRRDAACPFGRPMRERWRRFRWCQRIEARADARAQAEGLPTREQARDAWLAPWAELLRQRHAEMTDKWPYRRTHSTWAGGGFRVRLKIPIPPGIAFEGTDPAVDVYAEKVWAPGNKPRSGTDTVGYIRVSEAVLRRGLFCDGKILLDIAPDGRARWCEQARGQVLTAKNGWCIADSLIVAGTRAEAERIHARRCVRRLTTAV